MNFESAAHLSIFLRSGWGLGIIVGLLSNIYLRLSSDTEVCCKPLWNTGMIVFKLLLYSNTEIFCSFRVVKGMK